MVDKYKPEKSNTPYRNVFPGLRNGVQLLTPSTPDPLVELISALLKNPREASSQALIADHVRRKTFPDTATNLLEHWQPTSLELLRSVFTEEEECPKCKIILRMCVGTFEITRSKCKCEVVQAKLDKSSSNPVVVKDAASLRQILTESGGEALWNKCLPHLIMPNKEEDNDIEEIDDNDSGKTVVIDEREGKKRVSDAPQDPKSDTLQAEKRRKTLLQPVAKAQNLKALLQPVAKAQNLKPTKGAQQIVAERDMKETATGHKKRKTLGVVSSPAIKRSKRSTEDVSTKLKKGAQGVTYSQLRTPQTQADDTTLLQAATPKPRKGKMTLAVLEVNKKENPNLKKEIPAKVKIFVDVAKHRGILRRMKEKGMDVPKHLESGKQGSVLQVWYRQMFLYYYVYHHGAGYNVEITRAPVTVTKKKIAVECKALVDDVDVFLKTNGVKVEHILHDQKQPRRGSTLLTHLRKGMEIIVPEITANNLYLAFALWNANEYEV